MSDRDRRTIGPQSFLAYERFRYVKMAVALIAVSLVGYAWEDPAGGRSGSSWTGYSLGVISALLISWLMWLAVRRRSYRATGPPLKGWTSAHVYLGTALLILVPLHSGFEFGVNLHTLAYALMCIVVASGVVGVVLYALAPMAMTRNRNNITLEAMLSRISELDAECREAVSGLDEPYPRTILVSIQETRIGGGLLRQLSGRDPSCGTIRARDLLSRMATTLEGENRQRELKLIELIARKEALLGKIRREIRWRGFLDLWLILHVPLAYATSVAVLIHIFVVFWYH